MDSPIYTRIKNNTPIEKLVLAGEACAVIPAKGTADAPYELWSMAEAGQRTSIETEIADGSLEFTICVRTTDGSYVEVPFYPTAKAATSPTSPAPVVSPKVNLMKDLAEADDIFSKLMGDVVEPRREFIQANALTVENLDF